MAVMRQPLRLLAFTIRAATRSLMLPPGFRNSHLAYICTQNTAHRVAGSAVLHVVQIYSRRSADSTATKTLRRRGGAAEGGSARLTAGGCGQRAYEDKWSLPYQRKAAGNSACRAAV